MGLMAVLSGLLRPDDGAAVIHDTAASEEVRGYSFDFALSAFLDRRSAPSIRKVLFEEALCHREIRIDLSALEFIDSAGLAALVEAFAAAKKKGVKMSFHRPSEPSRRALRLTRLDQVFPILDRPASSSAISCQS